MFCFSFSVLKDNMNKSRNKGQLFIHILSLYFHIIRAKWTEVYQRSSCIKNFFGAALQYDE